eukprot:TRINITY_DN5263_c0_g1_i1.p1 TRINITY_DN5263_c0_g1~~TRINITY_DN5263_c0_g1_i1.p1  ORF type:complete len:483 (-),score=92.24 TRINITY_DN5263_c0_g1_i1:100-1548(-)
MGENCEPSLKDIAFIRAEVHKQIEANGDDLFYPEDIKRLDNDDQYVIRFCKHVSDAKEDYVDSTVQMIISTFQWRKNFGTQELNESTISEVLKTKGALYMRNRDQDGKRLLIFSVRNHFKGTENMNEMKKFFIYFLERIDREDDGDQITLFFDCVSGGIKNMDIEFIQYMINVFKDYYPWFLNYILVFEMPWVLSAAWKIIKGMLPPPAVKKIKFLSKSTITQFIEDDQVLSAWGGPDDWVYEFVPEKVRVVEDEKKRTVSFSAEVKDTLDSSSTSITNSTSPSKDKLLVVHPSHEIIFHLNGSDNLLGKFQVTNVSEGPTFFKIKTTSPGKYKVRPSMANLDISESCSVEIHVPRNAIECNKDRFLITVYKTEKTGLSHDDIAEIAKTSSPDEDFRLRCRLDSTLAPIPPKPSSSALPPSPATSLSANHDKKNDDALVKKVNLLVSNQRELLDEVRFLKNLISYSFIFLVISLALVKLGYL